MRSVLVLHDNDGDKVGPVILNGRPGTAMPKFGLTQPQISDIAAFLKAQAESKASRFEYKIQNVVTGNAKSGHEYFEAHCASCRFGEGDLKVAPGTSQQPCKPVSCIQNRDLPGHASSRSAA